MELRHGKVAAKKCIGLPMSDLADRRHNIFIAISLANKSFTELYLREQLKFALRYTADKVLVLIPGEWHAINLQCVDEMSRSTSLRHSFKEEDSMRALCARIVSDLPAPEQSSILLAPTWSIYTPEYSKRLELLAREYSRKGHLYRDISNIVRSWLKQRKRTITQPRLEALAQYVITELPLFLSPVRTTQNELEFAVNLYPGIGPFEELVERIRLSDMYNNLRKELRPSPAGIVDLQIED